VSTDPNRPKVAFDHRDPGLRPFIEVEAKVTLAILADVEEGSRSAREIVAELADTATGDAEAGAREMSDQIPPLRRLLPVCREGCSYCCHGAVFASSPEILRIADHVRSRPDEEQRALRERAAAVASLVRGLDLEQRAAARVPCPLLDTATGRCGVYPVRPVACRAYNSGSVEACKAAFDAGEASPTIPINPALFHVAHAYSFGMMTGCAAAGLDAGPYDLAVGVDLALGGLAAGEDLAARWLRGERVLEAATPEATAAVQAGYGQALAELAEDLAGGRLDAAARVAKKLDPDARRRERNRKKRDKQKR